jgi:NAD(P)H dehydrogenase (quinone)
MHVAIVFNHPYEGSFCSAMLAATTRGLHQAGHSVDIVHLDREGFNPVVTAADLEAFRDGAAVDPKVLELKDRLAAADHLIFIFPIWWELMPALTKGFVDKVIFPGVAYEHRDSGLVPMRPRWSKLTGITVMTTMNTPGWLYSLLFGNAIKKAFIVGTLRKIGYRNVKWLSFNQVKSASTAKRERWLQRIELRFAALT